MSQCETKHLLQVLEHSPKICAWQLTSTQKRSAELYTVLENIDTLRYVETETHALILRTPSEALSPDDKYLGEARLQVERIEQGLFKSRLQEAVEQSRYLQNPAYQMSASWQTACYAAQENPSFAPDTFFYNQTDSMQILDAMVQELQSAAKRLQRCRLSSSEFFLSTHQTCYNNHRGLQMNFTSTQALWDFALLSPDGEQEIQRIKKSRSWRALSIEETLERESELLLSSLGARLPPCGNMPVVLADEALDTLFDFFVAQSSGMALYHKFSSFTENTSVFAHEPLEPLTIRSNPNLPQNLSFVFFDELGYPIVPLTLIENNILKNYAIDGKHSFYLHMPRTSDISAIEVEGGRHSYQSFLQDGTLEILRLSTFQPNHISGNFSGEIRLGYWHKNGKRVPIKGGSVSGTALSFQSACYSSERERRQNYFGPKGVWFKSLTIAGAT